MNVSVVYENVFYKNIHRGFLLIFFFSLYLCKSQSTGPVLRYYLNGNIKSSPVPEGFTILRNKQHTKFLSNAWLNNPTISQTHQSAE